MDQYMLILNKDMIELGAVEIQGPALAIIDKLADSDGNILLADTKGETRKFKFLKKENLIEGRGIKGYFANIGNGFATAYLNQENVPVICPFRRNTARNGFAGGEIEDHTENILSSFYTSVFSSDSWFNLYDYALEFKAKAGEDTVLCLPFLRDVNPYNYQIKTVKAVLNRFRGRVLLGDEVGLGKTIEAGMAMMEYIMRGLVKKILILTPPSLVEQWYFEMKRKFNQDFVKYDDPDFKKYGDNAWENFNKVITSIATAKRKANFDAITRIQYDLVIVDEAHHLKNRRTLAWQFVNSLNKKYIFLLSATPVQNSLEELYNLITLLKPGQLKTYSYFKKNFVGDKEGLEVKNVSKLKELLSGIMIRNKRSDVDIRFTKRFASTTSLSFDEDALSLYQDISNFVRNKYNADKPSISRFILKSLQEEMGSSFYALKHTLVNLCNSEKIEDEEKQAFEAFLSKTSKVIEKEKHEGPKLMHTLKILNNFKDKMLIFTKYTSTQEAIVEFLRKNNYRVAVFNGQMKRSEKETQVEFFRRDAHVLVSTESGAEGRNIQFCNAMINYDLPWNPMAIEQRIGRIHRIGQERDVYVFNLTAKDTVEHYILELLDRKINMFEMVVGEVDMILGDIEEEMDFSDLIMNAWVKSSDQKEMEKEIEILGEKLLDNKKQYLKVKELDENLFQDSFEI